MEVLLDPTVIVSTIISLLIGMLSTKLTRLGDSLFSHASLIPTKLYTRIRMLKWRHKKKLILEARNQHNVTWSIIRAHAFLMLFALSVTFYLLAILIPPFKEIGSLPKSVQLFITSPIYILEVLWLIQREKAQELVRVAGKHITSK